MSDPPRIQDRRTLATLALVLALSVFAYVHDLPFEWTMSSPLSWDQAGHYSEAVQFADGIRQADRQTLRVTVRGADMYPPGHTVALGAWFLAFGQGMAAWLTFGLVVFVATTALLYRAGPVAAVAYLVSPLLAGLAPSLMVEPIAGLWLVIALSLFPEPGEHPVPWWHFTAFGVAAAGIILTKYNVGLPLLPAAVLAALLSRDRRIIVGTVGAVVFAAVCWACFLHWQDDGWTNFLNFAENRSNSAGQSPIGRLGWYASTFERFFVGARGFALVLGMLALVGGAWSVLRRRPWARAIPNLRLVLALAYVAGSMFALVRHEYLLSRNLVGPTLALFFAAGLVVNEMTVVRRRLAVSLVVLLAVASLVTNTESSRASFVERCYPARHSILRDLSEALTERLDLTERTQVTGSFNEFSPAWIRILRDRHVPGASIGIDAVYPLERDRSGLSDAWSEAYAGIVEGWHRDGIDRIFGIVVHDGGTFDSVDYRAWNRWKQNLVRAADESPGYRLDESIELRGGIKLLVYSAVADSGGTH